MNLPFAVNTIIGSCLILLLIFTDYQKKSSTDWLQRKIFNTILVFSLGAAFFSLLFLLLKDMPGTLLNIFAYGLNSIFFILLISAYYYVFIFVDYVIFKESERTRKIIFAVWIILSIHIFVFIIDFFAHLSVYNNTPVNIWSKSETYIKSTICYLPMLFMLCDFFTSHRADKKSRRNMVLLFAGITLAGLVFDTISASSVLIWPCLVTALLHAYFIIIRTDIQKDPLTGIGNRYSFNEFIDKLSRLNTSEAYSIVMIDMDHLKMINDTLGHQEGDNALKDMANIIKKCIRSSDFSARYGGDEFVLAANANYDISKLMERIQQAVDSQNEKHIRPFKLQISYGYDVFTTNGSQTVEEFLAHIDQLMYKNKENRRRVSDTVIGADE